MLLLHSIVLYALERIFQKEYEKLIIAINDKIRDEKLQNDIKREAAKISVLSSGKIDKYEYLTGKERLPSNQKRVINKLSLHMLLKEKLLKNKEKQLKIEAKSK